MYILQLALLRPISAKDAEDVTKETIFAVARSESLQVLENFFSSMLNTSNGSVEFYDSTLEDGVTPAMKAFKPGSPLEFYVPPSDSEMMFVDLGTLESRIDALKAEVEKQARETWNKMLTHVLDITHVTDVGSITSRDLETPVEARARALAEQTGIIADSTPSSSNSTMQDECSGPTLSIGVDNNVSH